MAIRGSGALQRCFKQNLRQASTLNADSRNFKHNCSNELLQPSCLLVPSTAPDWVAHCWPCPGNTQPRTAPPSDPHRPQGMKQLRHQRPRHRAKRQQHFGERCQTTPQPQGDQPVGYAQASRGDPRRSGSLPPRRCSRNSGVFQKFACWQAQVKPS